MVFGWFKKLKSGLSKSSKKISEGIKKAREFLGFKKKKQYKSDKARESALASLRHFG